MFSTSLFKLKSKTSQFLCKSCSLNIFCMAVIAILQSSWISSTICLEDVLFFYQCCVTHKINALDDCVRTVRPAVWDISLCLCSLRYFPAHVVPCSHMGFKHRARAGAAIVQKHWRGNKHKQHALSCLEVSLVPTDLRCVIGLCSALRAHSGQSPSLKWHWSVQYLLLTASRSMQTCCDKLPSS